MSKSLISLVDNSLLPAATMIVGKFLGVVFLVEIFNITWSVKEYSSSIFAYTSTLHKEDLLFVTSYSDLVMYIFLAITFTWIVIRAVYFHNTHVKPELASKLVNKNMLDLVRNSYDIYHQAASWLFFTAITNAVILVNVFTGKTYIWIGIITTLYTILLTVLLLQDVYREIENIKKHPGQYTWV